jgi:hypothetical protein
LGFSAVRPDFVGTARVSVVDAWIIWLQSTAVMPVSTPVGAEHWGEGTKLVPTTPISVQKMEYHNHQQLIETDSHPFDPSRILGSGACMTYV